MSDDEKKEIKVKLAPGFLEKLEEEMSNEELQELLDKICQMVNDGSFFENAVKIDMDTLEQDDPELYEHLSELEDNPQDRPTLH
jgi:hypothetical protein